MLLQCCTVVKQKLEFFAQLYKCLRWPQNAGKLASEHPFCKKIYWGGGGACPQTPLAWAAYAAAAYGSHVGFTHKFGNPLPQILDPPLPIKSLYSLTCNSLPPLLLLISRITCICVPETESDVSLFPPCPPPLSLSQ